MSNHSELVKCFTEESTGIKCPTKPQEINKDMILFIIRMVMSELDELAATVATSQEDKTEIMKTALDTIDKCKMVRGDFASDKSIIAAQGDAMVDMWYYMLNVACKNGINLCSIFDVVHAANMAKKDPTTGKFIRRESDGKILKPVGWLPPDIDGEIERQCSNGSFN